MRIVSVILLCACTADDPQSQAELDSGWAPGTPWDNDAVPAPRVILDGLEGPAGLSEGFGALVVAESGAGRVWQHDGQVGSVLIDGLDAPAEVLATPQGVVVIDGDQVLLVVDGERAEVASDQQAPQSLRLGLQSVWWVESGSGNDGRIWRMDEGDVHAVAEGLESPHGLAVVGERAMTAETGNWRIIEVSDGGAIEPLAVVGGTIRDVAADCEQPFYVSESTRWPYPGFVGTVSGGEADPLSESPPEPSRLLTSGPHLIWATKQSIHRVERDGGTFQTLAQRTAVGDMVIWGDTLIWTNPDRGEVLAVDL